MQTWPLPSSSASSTKALSSKSSQKKALFQISAEKDASPMWFLPSLTAEINDLLLVNNNSKQKITLLISSDNNSACYTAQALASLNSGGADVVSATMLSVIRNKPMILDFAKKYNKENGNNSSENNTTEYMNLLRIAASGRGVSTSSAKSLVIVTTVEALASRSRAILNAPYLEESKNNNNNSLDDDVKSTKSVNNAEQLAATLGNLCSGCDLICLPGVDLEFAEACSSSSSSKLVFIKEQQQQQQNTEGADASPKGKKKPAAKPTGKKSTSSVSKSASTGDQQVFTELKLSSSSSSSSSLQPHPELSQSGVFAWHFDDEATTLLLCCNNVPSFLKRLRILHGGQGENIENCLAAALLGAWCSSSSFALHIRLAHMFRHLLDRSGSIDKATGEIRSTETSTHLTLRVQAARAISIVASKAEPLSSPNCQPLIKQMIPRSVVNNSTANKTTSAAANPFLFRAICSFALGVAPHAALDKLCAAWGVEGHLVAGTTACKQAKRKQGALIHSLRMRYQTAHGDAEVGFVEFVCHMLIDQVSKMAAVSVGEVRSWLMWDVFFAPIYGRLTKFLRLIGILRATKTQNSSRTSILAGGEDEDKNSNKNNKNNKNMTYDFDEDLHPVDTPEDNKLLLSIPRGYKTAPLNTKQLPLHTAHERKEKMLHDAACEELLSAMPQRRVPMYIGDVGNLIGAWTKFNAKYEGRLGWTLTDFLMEHPDKFRVMNNLVLRVSESTHEPVRVRFDHTRLDEYADDEENDFVNDRDERSKKQRREDEEIAAMGGKKKIHTQRQRKKAVKAARNKKRYDRNKKAIAQDAKVPGYNKPKAKKLSGRGKKTNARNWKRS